MRIGELAHRTGVSRRALRYYEEQGLLVPQRTSNGYRAYGDDAPMVVRHITTLLRLGFNSETTRSLLPCTSGPVPEFSMCDKQRSRFEDKRAELDAQLRDLAQQRDALAQYLD
ncbi:MerR family transcriptional regulator [Actinoplanes sp. RD1]|uniref:MerR family transcriptional regulator n=1 Tax=Actinoplanes sp. RD1 TaxID=3064538 RepID=UPI0027408CA7|nr:MerR family transcriptional regulator [Actinoplanes sp. RD1]